MRLALTLAAILLATHAMAESQEHEVVGHIKQQFACRSDPDAVAHVPFAARLHLTR